MGSLSPKCDTRLQHWHVDVEKITISLKSIHPKSRCPLCFFCVNPLCKRSIYTERISNFIQPWARKTNRLLEALKHVALSSGEAGARLSQKLGIGTSADTLLRLARIELSKNISDIRFVGVDDWAYKKGHRYGTIICDLESHKPIDLLPDRSSKSLANWLKQYPTITIVTRDRSADGIKRGAPQAIQVADRWHLLMEMPWKITYIKFVCRSYCQSQSVIPTVHRKQNTLSKQTRNEIQQQERRDRKWKRILEVQSLYQDGVPIREIARRLKISRQSIRKYIKESMPEKVKSKRKSLLDPYKPFILHRLQQGCSNAMQLFREIVIKDTLVDIP
ncbi:transposase [Thermoactinomyces sp. CICC 10521]|uniref:transposase n=1 Tax=Thermoactinomyces sp. CICC 10521 TaxID=2767426 RepID=UPI0018DE3137|nr:transposase [Thermoactinomyces sp. CICC 10521]MBH8609428.1 transposase [Thermoactinomyces sp. CICC 10521]